MWQNLSELWGQMGGPARLVLLVLLAMSVLSLTVAIERLIVFRLARRQTREFAGKASRLVTGGSIDDMVQAARACSRSHVAAVLTTSLLAYQSKLHVGRLATEDVLESARRAGERAALLATAELKRGTGSLATIGATAPFVGLFGTVVGIIDAFAKMAKTGQAGLAIVAAGVAEALVTTALGLLVALPAVWFYNSLMQSVERFQVEMASSSSELLERLADQGAAERAADPAA